ncbi:MAG: sulfotransferase family 2 domain-containing protein [Pseudomonadota bacterium]
MIINDRHGFAFVHIPKAGGSTIRSALRAYDESHDRYYAKSVADHPVLGRLDYPHIPLDILAAHFQEDFERLRRYHSFAVMREPFARFRSAVAQRLRMYKRMDLEQVTDEDVRTEITEAVAYLSATTGSTAGYDCDFIHYLPQARFVYHESQQIVQRVYPLDHVDNLLGDISVLVGKDLDPEPKRNVSFENRLSGLWAAQRISQTWVEPYLPRALWKPPLAATRRLMFRTGVFRNWDQLYDPLFRNAEVRGFVNEYYAQDIALFKRVAEAALPDMTTT